MDISSRLGLFRVPRQVIYAGDDYLELYHLDRRKIEKTRTLEGRSVFSVSGRDLRGFVGESDRQNDIGVVLNSSHFIFNILEFDKIPFRAKLRRDLIEWKIKKVFPEDIGQYEHDFFVLNNRRVLSVLFKKTFRLKLEKLTGEAGYTLTYLGNSTIEAMNRIFRARKSPDFFLEIDGQMMVIVFQHRSIPYYIRKFRVEEADDPRESKDEIFKTIRYVTGNFGFSPGTFVVVSPDDQRYGDPIRQVLVANDLEAVPVEVDDRLFLPRAK